MSSRSFIAGVVAILGAVVGLYLAILGPDPIPPSGGATMARDAETRAGPDRRVDATEPPAHATLTEVRGRVEVRSSGEAWRPLNVGDYVRDGVALRTGDDGSASLRYREGVSVRVMPDTAIGIGEEGDVLRLVVSEGVVIADVQPGRESRIELTNGRGDTVARVQDGAVGVSVDSDGALEAAVTRGSATIRGGGETLELVEGYRTFVPPGAPPGIATELPRSLLLKVRWPDAATNERRQIVTGTTNPGARVRVGETTVRADERGRFKAVVQLREGVNTIGVFALDAVGRDRRATSPAIELDTRAPTATVETDPSIWD